MRLVFNIVFADEKQQRTEKKTTISANIKFDTHLFHWFYMAEQPLSQRQCYTFVQVSEIQV